MTQTNAPTTLKDQCYTAFTDFYGIDDKDETFDDDMQKAIVEFNDLLKSCNMRYASDDNQSLSTLLNECLEQQPDYYVNCDSSEHKFSFLTLCRTGVELRFDTDDLTCTSFDDFVTKLEALIAKAEANRTKYSCIEVIKRNSEGEKFSDIIDNRLFDTEQKAKDYIQKVTIPAICNGDHKNDTRIDDGTDSTYIAFDNDYSYDFYITTLTF